MQVMKLSIYIIFLFIHNKSYGAESPCKSRQIEDQSVVCVCDESYCDDIVRNHPADGTYVMYTSSQSGLRFQKSFGPITRNQLNIEITLKVNALIQYQRIHGFGGAVSDAAAINWRSLSPVLQDHFINSYFGENGLEYNTVRTPIGGSDFSTRPYAYNDYPLNDVHLSNFTFSVEDILYKIPMLKAINRVAKTPVYIVGTTWSPPIWMKTDHNYGGHSQLLPQYYQTYADYHLKFLELYNSTGISVWAITTTNEPINGIFGLAKFNSLGWTMRNMGKWIEQNLGPTIRNSNFKNVNILSCDDQRIILPFLIKDFETYHPKAFEYIDGFAVHYYTDAFVAPTLLRSVTKSHPDKFILSSEASEGSYPWEKNKVLLGSWQRAVSYTFDIIEDLNYNLVGWIDWNLCLNMQGGPSWVSNFVDSPVIVDKDRRQFIKQPMFYALGHFSKFIPRDSVRIDLIEYNCILPSNLKHVAFVTPRNTIVVVIYNNGNARTVIVENDNQQVNLYLEAHSINTVEFPYKLTAHSEVNK